MCDSFSSTGPVRAKRRRLRALVAGWLTPALLLATTMPARADEPQAVAPSPRRDYDAADPNRNTLTYLRAAANVSLLNYIIWQYDWALNNETVYRVTGRDIINNHTDGWAWDDDSLDANFFGHPIDGGMYFSAARATGLGFWETTPYAFGGGVMWELLSEYQKPAPNDVITTTLGGIALGEVLYRLSSLALDDSRSGFARLRRELVAFAACPPRGANRLVTGEAWADGPPPVLKPARIAAHGGFDQVTAGTVWDAAKYSPSVLLAVDAEYGDLLPAASKKTLGPYDFFDFYAGGLVSTQGTSGFELASLGLLHGWSTDISKDEGSSRDNNVLGLVLSSDYHGTNAIELAGAGLGLGDFLVVRGGPGQRLRLNLDLGWAPLAAVSSTVNPFVGTKSPRDYNFSTGATAGLGVRWDAGRVGQLGLWAREYGTVVFDGIPGQELFGYARFWYEVEAFPDLVGVGLASELRHRRGTYSGGRSDQATQLSLQLYLTLRL